MHTGLVNTDGSKMSKSVGNVLTVREILKEYGPDTTEAVPVVASLQGGHGVRGEGSQEDVRVYISLRGKAKIMEERRATKARRRDSGRCSASSTPSSTTTSTLREAITFMKKLIEDGASVVATRTRSSFTTRL